MSQRNHAAPLLEVKGLCAFQGRAQFLFDVSFEAHEGEVLLLVGRNGAGKSATMKSIMGLLPQVQGEIRFAGQPIQGRAPHAIARLGLAYVPEDRRVFTELTVAENLAVGQQPARAQVSDAPHWDVARVVALFPKLGEMLDRPAAQMSGGEQQMLTIARSLMGNPRAILLDEPSEGLAPIVLERIAQSISQLKQAGMTLILSEQNGHFASAIADRVVAIERGSVRFSGSFIEYQAVAASLESV